MNVQNGGEGGRIASVKSCGLVMPGITVDRPLRASLECAPVATGARTGLASSH
jgi:hypothetical protein